MTEYRVTWTIDVDAESPREAAQEALRIQRKEDSTATVFEVNCGDRVETVDLEPESRQLGDS